MPVKKNDRIEIDIDEVSLAGSGVGRYEGLAVFVPACAPADRVRAHIIKVKKTYAVGKLEQVLRASPDRADNDCPAFPACGGCSFRHISYEAELRIKTRAVRDAFERIGGLDVTLRETVGSLQTNGYRNKAQYPVRRENGQLRIGFYAPRSHRVTDGRACLLSPPEFCRVLEVFEDWIETFNIPVYDEASGGGVLRHIYIRKAFATGELMVCPVCSREPEHLNELADALLCAVPGIGSIVLNINKNNTNVVLGRDCRTIRGDGFITDVLCGLRVRLSPLSFYQVNSAQAQRMYEQVAAYAAPEGCTVLDLYCGAGTIGLSLARRAAQVIGVETVEQAVADARLNAAENNIDNARFICADAGEAAAALAQEGLRPDVVILDPPRKGCSSQTVGAAAAMNPKRIVYVSCDPATLARDCALFLHLGYEVTEATPFDMFARTGHVETVVLLSKLHSDHHIEVELNLDEMDLTASESKATYDEIKAYVLEKFDLKVSNLYIAQIKQKCGIIERENYNKPKSEDSKQPQCPPEKERAIVEALRHFKMI